MKVLHELFTRLSHKQQHDRRFTYMLSSYTGEREEICSCLKWLSNVSLCSSSLSQQLSLAAALCDLALHSMNAVTQRHDILSFCTQIKSALEEFWSYRARTRNDCSLKQIWLFLALVNQLDVPPQPFNTTFGLVAFVSLSILLGDGWSPSLCCMFGVSTAVPNKS